VYNGITSGGAVFRAPVGFDLDYPNGKGSLPLLGNFYLGRADWMGICFDRSKKI
jgi:hypothetical protein